MKKIYFVGLPVKEKGIEDFSYLAGKIKEAKFYWFCLKLDNSIKNKYKKINFLVGLNDREMKKKISDMDLMACCSRFEGFCLPIAEAILLKKPVISYRLKEVESTYLNNIEYIKCFSLNKYVRGIKKVISNKGLCKDAKKARMFVINNYSPEVVSQRLLKIIF